MLLVSFLSKPGECQIPLTILCKVLVYNFDIKKGDNNYCLLSIQLEQLIKFIEK